MRFSRLLVLLFSCSLAVHGEAETAQRLSAVVVDFEKKISVPLQGPGEADIDDTSAHSGERSLHIAYHFTMEENGIFLKRDFPVSSVEMPKNPWGLQFFYHRSGHDPLNLVILPREKSGEVWRVDIPLPAQADEGAFWRAVTVPLTRIDPITWERRDGILQLEDLKSISMELHGARGGEGEVWLDSFAIIDAVDDVSVRSQGDFTMLNLESVFDSDSIAYRDLPEDGDYNTGEWEPRTIPAELLPKDEIATLSDIPFLMPPLAAGRDNTIRSSSQQLEGFPASSYTAAYFLAAGKFGDQSGDVRLFYDDGTTEDVALRISDWSMDPQFNEAMALQLPYAYFREAIDYLRRPRVYVQSIRIDRARTLERIRLPGNDFLKVYAITLTSADPPPEKGELAEKSRIELDPRYALPDSMDIDFSGPARAAGVFGGYLTRRGGAYSLDVPTINGYLCFVAEARALPKSMLGWWGFKNFGGPYPLGGLRTDLERAGAPEVQFIDSTCQKLVSNVRSGDEVKPFNVYLSRAWPAAFYEIGLDNCYWYCPKGDGTMSAVFLSGGELVAQALDEGTELPVPDEPWLLLVRRLPDKSRDVSVPMLLVLEHKPMRIVASVDENEGGTKLEFGFAEKDQHVAAMPYYGIGQLDAAASQAWSGGRVPNSVIGPCREWARRLQRFPIGLKQSATVNEDAWTVTIRDEFSWIEMKSTWECEPLVCSPFPPSIMLARDNGYPVELPEKMIRTTVSSFYGPYCVIDADASVYTVPLSPYARSMVTITDVKDHPVAEVMESRLKKIVTEAIPGKLDGYPYISDVAGDLAMLRLYAPLFLLLGHEKEREAYARGVVRNALKDGNLKIEKEPESGQFYLMDDRFWAKDKVFDKEWCIGFMLQGLWSEAYYLDDFDFIKSNWNKILGLYRYYQIYFDWATNSTWTMATGIGANSDGSRIAYEGMLAFARMAGEVGDETAYHDALVRSACEGASLYASWFGPAWAAEHRYCISGNQYVTPGKIEQRFSPDHVWDEYFTCSATHRGDFFQATHALYTFNLAHLMFLHDTGLAEKFVRAWTFDIMPEMHPEWCNGNAKDHNGHYYGDGSTMTHLMARAILFSAPVDEAFRCYRKATENTAVLKQWYGPMGLAPMALASMITGMAPLVDIPVFVFSIEKNVYTVQKRRQEIVLRGKRDGEGVLRLRYWDAAPKLVEVDGKPAEFVLDEAESYARVRLQSREGEKCRIEVQY